LKNRKSLKLLRAVVFCAFWMLAQSFLAHAEGPLVVSCGAVGRELELCRQGAEAWAARTHHAIRVISAPADSGERLGLYQLQLAARSTDIDVFLVDTTWPGMIGDFFVDFREKAPASRLQGFFKAFLENNTVKGRITAIPWFIDAGLLYYRKDLLKKYGLNPPETWQELADAALRVQKGERQGGNDRFWGYVFQGRTYEGLTCNALEWVASFGGGTFVDAEGKITINNPRAVKALTLAAKWVDLISPPGVLNYMEEESRGVFQSGNALFLRNWPYVWQLAQAPDSPVRGKVGVSVLPKGEGGSGSGSGGGGNHAATLGGWSLAVSRFSTKVDAAVDLVLWLASAEEQKRRALAAGLNPTLPALYADPEILASNPIASQLKRVFESAIPRPARATGGKYNRVSAEIRDRVHRILEAHATEAQVGEELAALEKTLKRLGRDGKW
jgi:trehalose/maltose transport system substrate-binding protein